MTVEQKQRHKRLAVIFGSLSLLGMVAAFAIAPSSEISHRELRTVVESLQSNGKGRLESASSGYLYEETILRSDTVASLLARLRVTDSEAIEFIGKNAATQSAARQLRPGKTVTARTGDNGELLALHFPLTGNDAILSVIRDGSGFRAQEETPEFETQTHVKSGEIQNSLFGATDAAGIPDAIAIQMAEIFGGDIDFYRDLKKGDRFSIVYETLSHKGQTLRSGRILSAEFINGQKTFHAYWYSADGTKGSYYTEDGKSLRKAFLRSPLEFSRVTSGFAGARFHPVLQTWRAHRGVDYGAPVGTKVRAVADGVIEFSGRQGGYGNLILLKHQGNYTTAYGHLNSFGAGIRKGARVSQGDTIGYVGQTGLASGPHLHYEFRIGNQQVNPLAVTLPTAVPLDPAHLSRYKNAILTLREQLNLAKQIRLASAE